MENENIKTEDKVQNNHQNGYFFTIMKTFLFTVFVCVVTVLYSFAISFCLFPNFMVKISSKMNWTGGEVVAYEMIYDRSGEIEDLYNLTMACINNEKNMMAVKNIDKLQNHDDYVEFCEKLDLSAMQNSEKKYLAFVSNLDSYLQSQKVRALFDEKKISIAENVAFNDLKNTNKFSFAFETFVSCLDGDKKSLSTLAQKTFSGKTLFEWMDFKISMLGYDKLGVGQKILSVYTLLKINKTKFILCDAIGDVENKNIAQSEIQRLQNEYDDLVSL